MDFALALSCIIYGDFLYTFQYVFFGIFPILLYVYTRHSCSPIGRHFCSAQRKCHACSHTIKRERSVKYTRHQYEECDVGLCVIDCFQAYHILKHFSKKKLRLQMINNDNCSNIP